MSGARGKVVAITGASSGIGEAIALFLAERGAKVVLGARRLDRLEALATRIANVGGEAAYAQTDVSRRDDLSDLVKLACDRFGKLDVLVNNAGVMPISPLDELRVDDWESMIRPDRPFIGALKDERIQYRPAERAAVIACNVPGQRPSALGGAEVLSGFADRGQSRRVIPAGARDDTVAPVGRRVDRHRPAVTSDRVRQLR